jgi:hypothetical protein
MGKGSVAKGEYGLEADIVGLYSQAAACAVENSPIIFSSADSEAIPIRPAERNVLNRAATRRKMVTDA